LGIYRAVSENQSGLREIVPEDKPQRKKEHTNQRAKLHRGETFERRPIRSTKEGVNKPPSMSWLVAESQGGVMEREKTTRSPKIPERFRIEPRTGQKKNDWGALEYLTVRGLATEPIEGELSGGWNEKSSMTGDHDGLRKQRRKVPSPEGEKSPHFQDPGTPRIEILSV